MLACSSSGCSYQLYRSIWRRKEEDSRKIKKEDGGNRK